MSYKMVQRNIGRHIAAIRNTTGLSQRVFAGLIGMSQQQLSEIETGSTNITIGNLVRILDGLNTPLATFFDDDRFRDLGDPSAVVPVAYPTVDVDEAVLSVFRTSPTATISQVARRVDRSMTTIQRIVNRLKATGRLRRVGPANGGHWVVIDGDRNGASL